MLKRLLWAWNIDRIGPDVPFTHFFLYSKRLGQWLCRKKFKEFAEGAECRPHSNCICTRNILLGRNVVLRPGTMLYGGEESAGTITVGDDVLIGPGVVVMVHNHKFDLADRPIAEQGYYAPQPVVIESGSWLGANCIILPGVIVGRNAVVGAGAIVTKDVPPRTVVAGNPAKIIRHLDP